MLVCIISYQTISHRLLLLPGSLPLCSGPAHLTDQELTVSLSYTKSTQGGQFQPRQQKSRACVELRVLDNFKNWYCQKMNHQKVKGTCIQLSMLGQIFSHGQNLSVAITLISYKALVKMKSSRGLLWQCFTNC